MEHKPCLNQLSLEEQRGILVQSVSNLLHDDEEAMNKLELKRYKRVQDDMNASVCELDGRSCPARSRSP